MKKCRSCNIEFNTNEKRCPLCQNELEGEPDEQLFPKNVRYETNSLILKIVLFASIVAFLVIGFLDILVIKNLKLMGYVSLGLLTNLVVIYFILKSYQNIYKILGRYGFLLIILLLIWYFYTKSPVITNYIIPSVCFFELAFNMIVGVILRRNYMIKYSSQIMMSIFLLLIPIVLVALKMTTDNILSYICVLLSIISTIGLLIFFFDDVKEELGKIFNMNE
ncbi:MAG: DUF6320 domain-containing protein [Treponema sp.]|nr:hypothetical protein [Treponema sp.]MEE3312927.1 DUF6320 domain-containing protein [Treponema sp.]